MAELYLDNLDGGASDSNDGAIGTPWLTWAASLPKLGPGDTLHVLNGPYEAAEQSMFNSGSSGLPITVVSETTTVLIQYTGTPPPDNPRLRYDGADWWVFDNFIFDQQRFVLGIDLNPSPCTQFIFKNCTFRNHIDDHGLYIVFARDITVDSCEFNRLQATGQSDVHGIAIEKDTDNILIKNTDFIDISGDGIQLGNASTLVRKADILDCTFTIRRNPDGTLVDQDLQDTWGGTGENGIDVKTMVGPLLIKGCTFTGYRPSVTGQNASGSHGVAVVIHAETPGAIVDSNTFINNTIGIDVTKAGAANRPNDITIKNNTFQDHKIFVHPPTPPTQDEGGFSIKAAVADNIKFYHNTMVDHDYWLRSWDVTGCELKNNVIEGGIHAVSDPGVGGANWDSDFNAFSQLAETRDAQFIGTNDVDTADLQLDANLVPSGTSPVLDQGTNLGVLFDKMANPRDGTTPDMGAFEVGFVVAQEPMLDLSYRMTPVVASLPAASAALAGAVVRLSTNDNDYYCTGTLWVMLSIKVQTTAPASPETNDLWVDSA